LVVLLVATAVRAYPYYFPFLNSLSMGRPNYFLVNDSNLDWNQALPEVESFAKRKGLNLVRVDEYGFSNPAVYVKGAQLWNCQDPAAADAGQWVVVSAGMIADGHNCQWLLKYPYEILAAGSMYAFQLPATIPPPGSPDGPPLPEQWRNLAGIPLKGDVRLIFLNCIEQPEQLQPTWDRMMAEFKAVAEEQRKKK
jgi:hypothetical protein